MNLKPDPGTYAIILKNDKSTRIQIGKWGELDLQPGYYIYDGSAFGPGGVQARVSRHLHTDKRPHWHIDYLRAHVTPIEAWVSYETERLEHQWADILLRMPEITPIHGFGCSDCNCQTHLFYAEKMLEPRLPGIAERTPG